LTPAKKENPQQTSHPTGTSINDDPMTSTHGTARGKTDTPAFSFIRGPLGCLLVHGFGDTAALMEPMGSYLGAKGISTRGITLPGHGSSLEDFASISNQKLLAMVEREYDEFKRTCQSVVVVGFSMGGLLTLQLATLRDLEGIVTICTPMFPRGGVVGAKALSVGARMGGLFGVNIPKLGLSSLADRTLAEYEIGHTSYPSRSVMRLLELMESTRSVIKRVRAPILIVQARRDDVIWKKSGMHVYNTVESSEKKYLQLNNSRHKAPIDKDRNILFEEIGRFALACSKQSASNSK
jgi:carboxylesterase